MRRDPLFKCHRTCRMCANFNGRTCGEHGGITRNLAAALRFDNQHANAELIAQAVSVLESIQITAA